MSIHQKSERSPVKENNKTYPTLICKALQSLKITESCFLFQNKGNQHVL